MKAMMYITQRTLINKLKKAIHKPSAIFLILFWIAYAIYMIWFLKTMTIEFQLASKEGLVILMTFIILMSIPTNIISYVRKKGIVFQMSDLHFLFNSPIHPKIILIYRFFKLLIPSLILNIILLIAGMTIFKIPLLQCAVLFIFITIVDAVFETSLMLNLYANESLSEKQLNFIRYATWGLLGILMIYIAYTFFFLEPSLAVLGVFPLQETLLCIPLFGWIIAPYHLIILGPTFINIVTTMFYLILTVILLVSALKMKCTGKYYEEASEFAKEYSEKRKNAKKGQVSWGSKKKYKRANVQYQGSYAKAIFYRQILEYKKNRFFIFGGMTLLCLGAGIFISYLCYQDMPPAEIKLFILPGLSAYFAFLMSGYATKWDKELEKPYTFLIPDTPIKKLWYATLIEHIRSLIDGTLMVLIASIGLRLNFLQMIICIFAHVSVMAIKLYCNTICQNILGKSLGNTGITLLKMLFEAIIITIGIVVIALTSVGLGLEIGLISMIIYSIVVCGILMVLSLRLFEKYESID